MIYAIGGGNTPAGVAHRSIEIYDVFEDRWTLYEDYLPEGRTRLGVQNIEDKFLVLIGGDSACAGGPLCGEGDGDHPLTAVNLIDLRRGNRLITALDAPIPQLENPRATPATAVRPLFRSFELYVIAGRTIENGSLEVSTTTEVLSFDRSMLNRPLR
jgi:hypothetical protein